MSEVIATSTRKVPANLRTRLGKAEDWKTETTVIIRGTITEVTPGPRRDATNLTPDPDTITLDGDEVYDVGRDGLVSIATEHLGLVGGAPTRLTGLTAVVTIVDGVVAHVSLD